MFSFVPRNKAVSKITSVQNIDYIYIFLHQDIELLHKFHNAPDSYPTTQNFVTGKCTSVHISVKNGALLDICLMYYGICGLCQFHSNHKF